MLKRIRDEVIKMRKSLVDKEAGIKKGDIMDLDGSFPVSISNINDLALLEYCSVQLLTPNLRLPRRRPELTSTTWIHLRFSASKKHSMCSPVGVEG